MSTFIVTEKNIADALDKFEIVLLNFWGQHCGPCKVFGLNYENVSKKHPQICFGLVNAETEPNLCIDFQVSATPTLVILKEQTIIYNQSGSLPEYVLDELVSKAKTLDVSALDNE